MNARWRLRPHDPTKILELSRRSGLSPLVAQLLLNRGIDDPSRAVAFLDARLGSLHDPELLPGAVEAAERIVEAVRSGRKIVIYGDYDVDGVCGTSILWSCLRLAGVREPTYYIPHRVEEGYGVNAEALRRLAAENPAALIVTVDCGISAFREAELARELGVELIVTDHHTIGAGLPEADGHRPPAAARRPLSVRRPLRGGRGVQAGLADLQELRRRQEGLAPPPRLPGPSHGPGGAGDDRRRGAAVGREPDAGPARAGGHRQRADDGAAGADGGQRLPGQEDG